MWYDQLKVLIKEEEKFYLLIKFTSQYFARTIYPKIMRWYHESNVQSKVGNLPKVSNGTLQDFLD